jgi:hypothetical protein
MNLKTAKKLRRQAERMAVQTVLAAEQKGLYLTYGNRTNRKIYHDLKMG